MKTYTFYLVKWSNQKMLREYQGLSIADAYSRVPKDWEVSMFWVNWP